MSSTKSTSPLASTAIVRQRSGIHGAGVFASQPIAAGLRLIEYTGERIRHAEADRRYEDRPYDDNHTFLFTLNERTIVDGGVGGSLARFINHSCDGNCEVEIDRSRIFVHSKKAIAKGEELTYDYCLVRTPQDPPDIDEVYACRCGASTCRGSMMAAKPKRAAAQSSSPTATAKATKAVEKKIEKPAKTKAKAAKTKAKVALRDRG